jgi:DUF1680 family protein
MQRREFLKHCLMFASMTVLPYSAEGALLKPLSNPRFRPLREVPIRNVHIDDGFWSPKMAVWREVTIDDCLDKFEKSGAIANFDLVANGGHEGHQGDPWWDGLIYEMITATSDFLAAKPDSTLEKRIDSIIERIAAAASVDPDGYINTAVTLKHVAERWSDPPAPGDMHDDRYPHTVYNAGCLVEAGVHHYLATGKTTLLTVATRMANYMCRIMGPPPRQNIVPGHAISELSFIELCLLYRDNPDLKARIGMPVDERKYLELAEFWIDNRGNHHGRTSMEAYDQDDRPVVDQFTLEGHAVRAALLAAGIAKAIAVDGRADYARTARRWWDNMVDARMYVTGGLGSVSTYEGFGKDYELPNDGYAETCAAVAGSFFSHNLGLVTGEARYFDIVERELFNGALSGVSLAGTSYFYTNPLASNPDRRRWEWNSCPCCPPMFLKLMGALPSSIYATDSGGVYVNQYVGSHADIDQDGLRLNLKMTTSYPWDGAVRVAITRREPSRFALYFRLPGWSCNVTFRVNGKTVEPSTERGYAMIERTWRGGHVVEMSIPLPVERVKADHRVAVDVGRVALMRGPVVYCLEGIDNGGRAQSLVISPTAAIRAEHRHDLLGGVTVLTGEAEVVKASGIERAAFMAVPFYTNTNREPTDMTVWPADARAYATPWTLAGASTPTASHCYGSDTVWALNNGQEPRASDDDTIPRFTWWDHRGTSEWVQYDFPEAEVVHGVDVYWWDETRVHRDCRVPQSWEVQYLLNGEWRPVDAMSAYGAEIDAYNRSTFAPVRTTALRIVAQLQPGWSGGILQWCVLTKDLS